MTVIFPDRNISPSYFKDAPANSLLVRTIFYTIQGEGPLAGRPAVFVRLGGCNLGAKGVGGAGCEWCDTDFRLDKSVWMTFDEIQHDAIELIRQTQFSSYRRGDERPLYVITGGEPMLQVNLKHFIEFSTGWDVQIETNGLYYMFLPPNTTVVVSPKLGGLREYPSLREEWLADASCLKFVLEADPNSPYHTVPGYAFSFRRTVYVSPIAVYAREMTPGEGERASIWGDLIDGITTAKNYQYAAEYALKHNLRLSMQTHLFANMP